MDRIEEENYDDEAAKSFSITSEQMRTGTNGGYSAIQVKEPLLRNGILKDSNDTSKSTNLFKRSKKWLYRKGSSKKTTDISKSVPTFNSNEDNNKQNNGITVNPEISSVSPGSAPVSTTNGHLSTEKTSTGSHCSVKVYCVTNEANV